MMAIELVVTSGGSTGPIVLDLNHNGITSLSIAASLALFDYDGDGLRENTAWVESGDALLVSDLNSDGIINDASELFGNYTKLSNGSYAKSGYQALEQYDTNQDGVIDVNDSGYGELKLWIDSNGDGITDAGELVSLADAGVSSIALFCIETDIYTNRAKFNKELTEQKVNYNHIKLIDSINKNYQQLFLAHLTDNNQNLTNEREVA